MANDDVCYVHEGPQREIANQIDLTTFLSSNSCARLFSFLEALNECIKNKKTSDSTELLANEALIVNLLTDLERLIVEYPPTDSNNRFGNPAFRDWFDASCELIRARSRTIIPGEYSLEISEYLTHALGNRQRIDYGTGHESHFLAFLFCLNEVGFIAISVNMVFCIFTAYLKMIRKVQSTYWLEPAGSLGVWGLDDYHFLPFLFGSSQLADHPHLRPKSIHDADIREAFKDEYLYYEAIDNIVRIKGPFLYQHSPMLDDISSVKLWSKVNSGLIKMYRGEVFSKLPVMQHFIFGRLIPFKGHSGAVADPHEHHQGDCCGNALPSAFPAAIRDNLRGLPSLPFD